MNTVQSKPVACTLPSGQYSRRMVWIAELNRANLLQHEQNHLRLTLQYRREALAQVRELVRMEQQCCSFLTFTVRENAEIVEVVIDAPEASRGTALELFDQFRAKDATGAGCACATAADISVTPHNRFAGVAAASSATAALACGVCCVLPFALPAVIVSTFGGVFAMFAGVYWWALGVAVAAVAIGWLWVVQQSIRTKKKPAMSTIHAMGVATVVLAVAGSWSFAEPHIIAYLK